MFRLHEIRVKDKRMDLMTFAHISSQPFIVLCQEWQSSVRIYFDFNKKIRCSHTVTDNMPNHGDGTKPDVSGVKIGGNKDLEVSLLMCRFFYSLWKYNLFFSKRELGFFQSPWKSSGVWYETFTAIILDEFVLPSFYLFIYFVTLLNVFYVLYNFGCLFTFNFGFLWFLSL